MAGSAIQTQARSPNRLAVNNRRIRADRGNESWLSIGRLEFRSEEIFSLDSDPGIVMVNLDLSLQIGSRNPRVYTHRDEMVVQIMNP